MQESTHMDDTTTTYSGRLIAMAGVNMIERWRKNFENVRKRKNEKSDKKDILESSSHMKYQKELALSTPDILKKDQRLYIQEVSSTHLKLTNSLGIQLLQGKDVKPYCQCFDMKNDIVYSCMSKESCKKCHDKNWR